MFFSQYLSNLSITSEWWRLINICEIYLLFKFETFVHFQTKFAWKYLQQWCLQKFFAITTFLLLHPSIQTDNSLITLFTNRKSLFKPLSSVVHQCRQVLPIVGSCNVNLFLFCFDGGQVPQRCLVSKFASSIKCFGLLPQVHAQQGASFFWRSQSPRNFNCIKRNTKFIMSSIKCFDLSPQVRTVQALSGSNVFYSDGEAFVYFSACFSMKTTRWAGFACA